ncbi:hypothetical protein TEQG_02482 [Trichophyton equinum CBS 127.97]|uniref:Uncharacterized protein n=1 Tax=Trichophyton equinum (strain ATCC MYA-4606 / CBS 127.97) TaxID=559882 RepID=F2PNH8_TRIEC|nr:hypothetical protein TEQG_02482 [Trichophyton equinum CBS 127.97]
MGQDDALATASADVIVKRRLHDLGDTLCHLGLNKVGTYLKDISDSPDKKKLFFDTITSEINRETRRKVSSQAEFFAEFKSGEERLSRQQVDRLVNIVSSWDLSDMELMDLRTSAKGWSSNPSSFFESDKPSASGTDGLIQLCFNEVNHLKETGGTHRKLGPILLYKALQHKEVHLQELREQPRDYGNNRRSNFHSRVVEVHINCHFGDRSQDEKRSIHRKMSVLRVAGSKWYRIKPHCMILALNNANGTRFERDRLEPIEIAALNAYIPNLKAYQEKDTLKLAFWEILNEYKRRSLHIEGNSPAGQENDLGWLDSLYSDGTGSNGAEESGFPLAGSGNDTSYPRSVNHPNHLSSWTNPEQPSQAVVEPRCPPNPATNNDTRLHQSSSNILGGYEMVPWFQGHNIRDANTATLLSQQVGELNVTGFEQQSSSQVEPRHQETRGESFSQQGAKRRRTNAAQQASVTRLTHGSWGIEGQSGGTQNPQPTTEPSWLDSVQMTNSDTFQPAMRSYFVPNQQPAPLQQSTTQSFWLDSVQMTNSDTFQPAMRSYFVPANQQPAPLQQSTTEPSWLDSVQITNSDTFQPAIRSYFVPANQQPAPLQ